MPQFKWVSCFHSHPNQNCGYIYLNMRHLMMVFTRKKGRNSKPTIVKSSFLSVLFVLDAYIWSLFNKYNKLRFYFQLKVNLFIDHKNKQSMRHHSLITRKLQTGFSQMYPVQVHWRLFQLAWAETSKWAVSGGFMCVWNDTSDSPHRPQWCGFWNCAPSQHESSFSFFCK